MRRDGAAPRTEGARVPKVALSTLLCCLVASGCGGRPLAGHESGTAAREELGTGSAEQGDRRSPETEGDLALVEAARSRISRGDYDGALASLAQLGPDPDFEDPPEGEGVIAGLYQAARDGLEAQALWHSACMLADPNDEETVSRLCGCIDPSSPYRQLGCCRGARPGEHLCGGEVEEAHSDVERSSSTDARLEPLDPAAPGAAAPELAILGAGPHRDPDDALEEARQALLRDDQEACYQALRGASPTVGTVSLLVLCAEDTGRRDEACAVAASWPRVPRLRQFWEARCR